MLIENHLLFKNRMMSSRIVHPSTLAAPDAPDGKHRSAKADEHACEDIGRVMDAEVQAGEPDKGGYEQRGDAVALRQQRVDDESDGKGAGRVAGRP